MRKIWFILLMIGSISTFVACSDDDDDDKGKDKNPVTEIDVPTQAEIGSEVTILGNNFSSTALLYLKDVEENQTEIKDIRFTATGATFTIPADLVAGDYTVILKQDGEWVLGTIKLVAAPLGKRVKTIQVLNEEWAQDQTYTFTYRDNKLIGVIITSPEVDWDTGEPTGGTTTMSMTFEQSGNTITTSGDMFDEFTSYPFTLYVTDGRVSKSTGTTPGGFGTPAEAYDYEWSYNSDGYLSDRGPVEYKYLNNNLLSTDPNYPLQYSNNDLVSVSAGVDVTLAIMFYMMGSVDQDHFYASMLGVCGEQFVNLPSAVSMIINYETFEIETVPCKYAFDGDSKRVQQVELEGTGRFLKFTYEDAL